MGSSLPRFGGSHRLFGGSHPLSPPCLGAPTPKHPTPEEALTPYRLAGFEGPARQSCLDPGYRRSWSGSLSRQHRPASCTVQGTCKQFGRCFSGRSSAKLGLQNNFKWTGIVLQFRLHEKSARQTNSKTNRQASSWCRAIPARLLSSTQLYDTLALAPNAHGNTNSAALEEAAGGSRFFNSASYTQRLKMPVNISLAFMIRRNMPAEPPGCED